MTNGACNHSYRVAGIVSWSGSYCGGITQSSPCKALGKALGRSVGLRTTGFRNGSILVRIRPGANDNVQTPATVADFRSDSRDYWMYKEDNR